MLNQNQEILSSIRYAMASSNLPALVGSSNEIEMARNIRIDMLIEADDIIAGMHKRANEGERLCNQWEKTVAASSQMRGATSAGWWVAHRDMKADAILKEFGN